MTRSVPRNGSPREWRGIFMFPLEHRDAMVRLADDTSAAVLEGTVDGRLARLDVTLTGLAEGHGLAFFEASGEPY